MKIIAIRGRNLASLAGDFEINFSEPPLCNAGIFVISGSTGSGKSTLLDAMCIALYATSPRLNKVSGNNNITDTGTHTIKEHDPRNILRKGTANGYAEVDFKALDGHNYRARWSVRRARDNNKGKIQDSEHTLICLTDGSIINGGKGEIIAKTSELIGLTYEQFTRAVLLAQGEFATFLKATAKEKAEILEKLTGTDIYSKISAKIYEYHKEAITDIKLIEEKIKDMPILSKEDENVLYDKKREAEKQQQIVEEETKIIERKIAWIERNNLLKNNIENIQKELAKAEEALAQAKNDIEYISRIDSTREIRDTYQSAIQIKKQIDNNKKIIEENYILFGKLNKELTIAKEDVKKKNDKNEEINTKWLAIQPKLKKAVEFEGECRNIATRIKEIDSEIEKKEKELFSTIAAKKDLSKASTLLDREQENIKEWFKRHNIYSSIIPQCNIIISNIATATELRRQLVIKKENLHRESNLLENEEKRLIAEEKEAERLNAILPTEIANLRKMLVEGEACPVCGSKHHEITEISIDTLKEEQLQTAKERVNEKIDYLKKSINNTRHSININNVLIEKCEEDIIKYEKRNTIILSPLKDIFTHFDSTFAAELQEISTQWECNQNRDREIESTKAVNQTRTSSLLQREKELQKELLDIKTKAENARNNFADKKREIAQLIGEGRNVKEIENYYVTAIKDSSEKFAAAIEKRGDIMAAQEKIRGSIAQAEKQIKELSKEQQTAKTEIEAFLENRDDAMTLEELHSLMVANEQEILNIRKKLEILRNNIVSHSATLKERVKAMEEHKLLPEKTCETETKESLTETLKNNALERKILFDAIGTINGEIKQNEENKKQSERYRNEYEQKTALCNKWNILNETFGSATGDKFKIIAQGYTLDILLDYANQHLQNISQRYFLARTSNEALAIKVIDKDMFGEERSVYSLSGGESFIVSLAMALALSSLSSNKMNIESLFIDEGFGSLDNETLRTAMEALERLQNLGRKVGVISHLQEMIERIPVKIKITKEQEGKSKVSIEVS